MKKFVFIALTGLFLLHKSSFGQLNIKDSIVFAPLIGFNYSFQSPGGDLKKRFGYNSCVGSTFILKTKKQWIISGDWNFIFGSAIKEDSILSKIETSTGNIINGSGQLTKPRQWERGWYSHIQFGRLLIPCGPNKNSGIFAMAGPGFLLHKVRIEDIGNTSYSLTKEMRKGYDRLTYGFSTSEFIGYMFLGNKRLINFFCGVEFIQGFTQNRRGFNYDTGLYDTAKRLDLLTGVKAGLFIPLYKRLPNDYYYY